MTELDPSTPVLVGVGEASERIDDPEYHRLSAVDLGALAAARALDDAGIDPAEIDVVAAVRQFEIGSPIGFAPLGRSNNYPRSVAARIGAEPIRAVIEISGGQSPQHLVNEFAASIAAGESRTVLLVGAEAISTARHLTGAADRPDFTEHVDGDVEDRGYGIRGLVTKHMFDHGLLEPVAHYALMDNARRARRGTAKCDYLREMAELFAPFSAIAAGNPHAAAAVARTVAEIATRTDTNRPIAEPYLRHLVSRDQVNQGAAVLLTSLGEARRRRVPESQPVFLHGHADLTEQGLLDRPDLDRSPAAVHAVTHALDVAGVTVDDVGVIDLYSCFPIAVSNICDALGIAPDDPRGLTVTGGLPYFGGAGNNYSMHAIAEVVERLRAAPGTLGLVGANGGMLSKYSAGVYSTTPAPWRPDRSAEVQADLDAAPRVPLALRADGPGVIETYTVRHGAAGKCDGIVIGRLDADGRRFLARILEGDDQLLDALLADAEPIGTPVFARSFGVGNRVTRTQARMGELRPTRTPALREDYEHVSLRRDGHLLEITIERADARNALHPPANDELDEVFDAYFADPRLWVAIITGAGTTAFCSGNDLMYSASGKPLWFPKNGFGGLTGRRGMSKPVIAAVNGFAMGGGLELALACHVVVADDAARFALSEVKVGLVAAMGGLVRLPRAVPKQIANEMVLTGRRLTATEALRYGLVNRVVPAGTALDGARALAAEILEASPTSVRLSLQMMADAQQFADPLDAVDASSTALDELIASQDLLEGMVAFGEKRTPHWHNR
ncbi:MAG: acetyl-CoA acetyltransferase [Jatrophihabitans sp.]